MQSNKYLLLVGLCLLGCFAASWAPTGEIEVSQPTLVEKANSDGVSKVEVTLVNQTGKDVVLSRADSEQSLSCCSIPEKETKMKPGGTTTAAYSIDERSLKRDGFFPIRVVYRMDGATHILTHRLERDTYQSLQKQ